MSPILVRPVREQLEHDRIIRQLQAKFRRKYEAAINPGAEQNSAVGSSAPQYPDVVLMSMDRARKVQAVVEVETGESVNHLEALAEWAHFARLRVPFHLYVPAGMVDVARRLCEDNSVYVSEIWSYHAVGDQIRFILVHRNKEAPPPLPRKAALPTNKPKAAPPVPPKPPAVAKGSAAAKAPPPKKKPAAPAKKKASAKPATKKKQRK